MSMHAPLVRLPTSLVLCFVLLLSVSNGNTLCTCCNCWPKNVRITYHCRVLYTYPLPFFMLVHCLNLLHTSTKHIYPRPQSDIVDVHYPGAAPLPITCPVLCLHIKLFWLFRLFVCCLGLCHQICLSVICYLLPVLQGSQKILSDPSVTLAQLVKARHSWEN